MFSSILGVGVPCTYIWLCVFYGLFHAWTNFWGEMTRFGDRRFYSDWWNAGNLSEFWRKWNYPIHNWLVRHCYFPCTRNGINSEIARLLTFLVSAVFHEYCIVGIFRKCNLLAFFFMIINIPLIKV
jgi:diacylglycerol O-acyltransferase-1